MYDYEASIGMQYGIGGGDSSWAATVLPYKVISEDPYIRVMQGSWYEVPGSFETFQQCEEAVKEFVRDLENEQK